MKFLSSIFIASTFITLFLSIFHIKTYHAIASSFVGFTNHSSCISTFSSQNTTTEFLCDFWIDTDGSGWFYDSSSKGNPWFSKDSQTGQYHDYCTWQGIRCSGSVSREIQNITLPDANLSGKLPNSIGKLNQLEHLNLKRNKISGKIPDSLKNATRLHHINFHYNNFSGHLPDWIFNSVVTHLDFSFNRFNGPFPQTLSSAINLRRLYLFNNTMSGPVPEDLFSLTNLSVLQIGCNYFNGSISPNLSNMVNLVDLNIAFLPNLEPSMFLNYISNFPHLEFLVVSNANLQGELPKNISTNTRLKLLDLNSNQISKLPSNLDTLQSLKRLFASNCSFSGPISSVLGLMEYLEELDFSYNQLTGPFPYSIACNFQRLRTIDFSHNLISADIIDIVHPECNSWQNVESFDFSHNLIYGDLDEIQFLFIVTQAIDLQNNMLTGTFPYPDTEHYIPFAVNSIFLQNNLLSGNLSDTIMPMFFSLEILDLSSNKFSGVLPSIPTLNYLNVSFNQFFEMPTESSVIHNYMGIEYLYLSHNEFSMPLPNWLFLSSQIVDLDISGNNFWGPIPKPSQGLQRANVESNQLCGIIPFEMCGLKSFQFTGNNDIICPILPCISNAEEYDCSNKTDSPSNRIEFKTLEYFVMYNPDAILVVKANLSIPVGVQCAPEAKLVSCAFANETGSAAYLSSNGTDLQVQCLFFYLPNMRSQLRILYDDQLVLLETLDEISIGICPGKPNDFCRFGKIDQYSCTCSCDGIFDQESCSKILPAFWITISLIVFLLIIVCALIAVISLLLFYFFKTRILLLPKPKSKATVYQRILINELEGGGTNINNNNKGYSKIGSPNFYGSTALSPNGVLVDNNHNNNNENANLFSMNTASAAENTDSERTDNSTRKKPAARKQSTAANGPNVSSSTSNYMIQYDWCIPSRSIRTLNKLGSGSMGEVYRGKQNGTTDVAIKVIRSGAFNKDNEESFNRFLVEVNLWAKLRCPYIVSFFGACLELDSSSIIMEYMNQGNLSERIRANDPAMRLSWPMKLSILRDVSAGMCYLHSQNLCHRDVKSSNILLSGSNSANLIAKISDFGISKTLESQGANTIAGTPFWISPEVYRGERYGLKSDCFSFGILLWELLTEMKPSSDISEITTMRLMGKNPPVPKLEELLEINGRPVLPISPTASHQHQNIVLDPVVLRESIESYISLMELCWNPDPEKRPSFEESDIPQTISNILEKVVRSMIPPSPSSASTSNLVQSIIPRIESMVSLNKGRSSDKGKASTLSSSTNPAPLSPISSTNNNDNKAGLNYQEFDDDDD